MFWQSLLHRIERLSYNTTNHYPVYAILENPKTHTVEKVFLDMKLDASGHPYFIRKTSPTRKKGYKKEQFQKKRR